MKLIFVYLKPFCKCCRMLMQKCKGRREKDNSRTIPSIHRNELFEKGEHSFPFTDFVKIE